MGKEILLFCNSRVFEAAVMEFEAGEGAFLSCRAALLTVAL